MNTSFSFHRIGLLLRRDWIEYKKMLGYFLIALIGTIVLFLCVYKGMEHVVERQYYYLRFGLLACFIFYLSIISKRIHHSKGLFLTLPASSLEKFLTLLITGFIIFLIFISVFWISIYCISLFIPGYQVIDISTILDDISSRDISNINILSFLSFTIALIFLAFVTFPKHAFVYVVCGFLLSAGLIIGTAYVIMKYYHYIGFCTINCNTYAGIYPFLVIEKIVLTGFAPVMFISSVIILYVAYLKLKEKELK
ncbi:hypothetical protein [Parabacteroides bouchesdurhonensis]|uniref:hypothetical protein n=1 Tax=Parabacteroides bouchesdurhonensis TaxID=1936995 RepID=UPI000E4FDF33|nr:hypothetical protein [Parabacteroides bouchesdurhonensis]RHJ91414.1 hypothetical protein DW095_10555 [Bacteroides sp. AM07-16]